jgi:Kef-type K+ transport system membrane component KefB
VDQTFLIEFGVILAVATVLGVLARVFRQPLILAYLIAGIVIGPFVFGLVKDSDTISSFASIGIIFLLFLVGLELNPRKLLEVGRSALVAGLAQIIFSGLIYFLVANVFGLSGLGAFYLAIAFTFSSTAIIVTLLSNRRDLDSLHGKMLIGILLIQDILAILILTFASGLKSGSVDMGAYQLGFQIVLRALVLFALIYLVSRYVLPPIFHRIARSSELLFLSSLAWCFVLSIIAIALGFSAEIGAFLAGISLAPLPFSTHVAAKTRPLRDFFLMIFFVYLGTTLIFTNMISQIVPAIVFSLLILIVNPIIVMIAMALLGFRKRTSFITGITLTQVSEFSFIVIVLGTKIGVLPPEYSTLASIVAIITVFVSTYLISNSNKIYHAVRAYLGFLEEGQKNNIEENLPKDIENHVILVGCNRMGSIILEELKARGQNVIVVDFNPSRIKELTEQNVPSIFGDAVDHDIAEKLHIGKANMLISTIDKFEEDELIIKTYKKINRDLEIIATANDADDARDLYSAGADLVVVPAYVTGDYTSHIIKQIFSGDIKLEKLHEKGLKELKEHE